MEKTKRTINPNIAKMTFGDEALCGASKMVFCEHEGKTVFGGVAVPNISNFNDEWHMAVGSLIFVPLKIFRWNDGICGWSLEELVTDGFDMENWKEIKRSQT